MDKEDEKVYTQGTQGQSITDPMEFPSLRSDTLQGAASKREIQVVYVQLHSWF